ncbi:MAG: PIN domain-containing protein [Elusimicrobiota bacterium]|nr:PIN domain-containing protein [Elusimicrobiota bacterium]
MILVDSSILISYLKGDNNPPYNKLDEIINNGFSYGISKHIYLELLQGAKNNKEYEILKYYLDDLPFYELKYGRQSYENAAKIYIKCRQAGITIKSTIDLIITQTAIENKVSLFHNDKDFTNIAEVITDLKIF